jgi:hypothetical protein
LAETVYEMMVKLSLDHHAVTTGLGQIGTMLASLHKQISGPGGLHNALVGLGRIAIGGAMLDGVVHIMNATKALNEELVKVKLQGGAMESFVDSGAARKQAFDIAAMTGLKPEDVVKLQGINFSLMGKEGLDPAMMQKSAQAEWVLSFLKDYKGDFGTDMTALMRAGEATGRFTDPLTGQASTVLAEKFYNQAIQAIIATHGMVTPQQMLGLGKQGGFAERGLTDEGFMTDVILAQVLGGQRVGTASLGIYNQLARGQMTQKTAEGMQEAGLLKKGEWSHDKSGVHLDPEVSKRLLKAFSGDPMNIIDTILKHLDAQGITDPSERLRIVANAFSRQTTQRLAGEMATNYNQILSERDRAMGGATMGKAGQTIDDQSIEANIKRLENSWHALWEAIAGPNSEAYIAVLKILTGTINSLSAALLSWNPEDLKKLVLGITGLGLAFVGAGVLAMFGAIGTGGWLIGGFVALAAINWDKIKPLIDLMRQLDQLSHGGASSPDVAFSRWLLDKLGMGSKATPGVAPAVPPWGITPRNQSFQGNGITGPRLIPVNFNTGSAKQPVIVHQTLELNIDGRILAQAVSDALDDLSRHPTSSASANHWTSFANAGGETTETS